MLVLFIFITLVLLFVLYRKLSLHDVKIKELQQSLASVRSEVSNRDILVNRRVDGEIDRVNKISSDISTIVSNNRSRSKDNTETLNQLKISVDVLEQEVDKMAHTVNDITVTLQNEINKSK